MHPLGVYIPSPTRLEDDGLTPLASRRSMGDEMKLGPSYSDRPLLSSGSPGVRPHQSGGGSRTRADEGGQSATSESARTIPYRARPRSDSRVRIPQTSSAHLTGIVRRPRLARTPSYATPSDASSPQVTHRVKGKKSGLMELWNKASSSRPRPPEHAFPTPATSRPAPTRE